MSQNIFKNPYVLTAPILSISSIGNGTLTVNKLTHFTVAQSYTVICTAIDPFTVFKVIGSLDGAVGVAIVGTEFSDQDKKIFFTLQQGPTTFEIGDTFTLEVANGTDLNQENIDSYDELPQKNFGPGQQGNNLGDENLRYKTDSQDAIAILGDLKFTSKLIAEEGNAYSIQFFSGTNADFASLSEQGIDYISQNTGPAGNLVSLQIHDFIPSVFSTLSTQNILFTAVEEALEGDNIGIEFIVGGSLGSEVVTVANGVITIQIDSGVSTVNTIISAISGVPAAAAIISGAAEGTGLETVVIAGALYTSGGAEAIGLGGSEVAVINGNQIDVYCQIGLTDLDAFIIALNTNTNIGSLLNVNYVQTGIGTDLIALSGPTNFTGGVDGFAEPGQEIFSYIGTETSVTFVNGFYDASSLKTMLEADPTFDSLYLIELTGDGTEAQSPIIIKSLKGGYTGPVYAFNENEISDPDNFHEGNANLLIDGLVVQGDARVNHDLSVDGEATVKKNLQVEKNANIAQELEVGGNANVVGDIMNQGDIDTEGILSLRDQSGSSGSDILNTQKTINALKDGPKLFFYNTNNTEMLWESPILTLATDLNIEFPETGIVNKVLAADTPLTIADGEHVFITIDKLNNSNLVIGQGLNVPSGEDVIRLVSRVGDYLIWADNTLHRNTKSIRIGEVGITRLRNDDVYSELELVNLGMDRTYLTHDTKIYISSLDKTLDQAIADDDFSGGGAGVGLNYDTYGNVTIQMTPVVETLMLQSPDLTMWLIQVADNGAMTVEEKLSGTIDIIKFRTDILEETIQLKINNDGSLYADSITEAGSIFDAVFFKAPNGIIWELRSYQDLTLYTKDGSGNCWKVTNILDELVFGFRDTLDGTLHITQETQDIELAGPPTAECGNGLSWRWGTSIDGMKSIFSWDSVKQKWTDIVMRATQPYGSTIDFWGKREKIPFGFLAAEGQSLLISEYPELYEIIGWTHGHISQLHFNLPDTRGVFIRGVDAGRGYDIESERTIPFASSETTKGDVGSVQVDTTIRETGQFGFTDDDATYMAVRVRTASGVFTSNTRNARHVNSNGVPGYKNVGSEINYDNANQVRTSTEARPKNIYAYKIMRVK